ncbi:MULTISPECIES: L-cysteine desulfidase family protein [unclassified Helicobacter]|uniref:L-cysteine desulfidase family protein n=1 Tax=unclassified Helicobacter TaxID=2593540 RepID=UPI000CF192D3|nr:MULTISPECIES: L-serine ammonia-lyase, iron-sulfur-dependent, subunit alpha [unclassified Helicobacter]
MNTEEQILRIMHQEIQPSLGCTEPVSVAYACAILKENLESEIQEITLFVSANLAKNAMAVTIPKTNVCGLKFAAALGYLCGQSSLQLEVLKHITQDDIENAKEMLNAIHIHIKENVPNLYIEAIGRDKTNTVRIIIQQDHTYVLLLEKNQEILIQNPPINEEDSMKVFDSLSLKDIYDFACCIEEDKIAFIAESAVLNTRLSEEGLKKSYGLGLTKTFQKYIDNKLLNNDLSTQILMQTTAASDARMGGAPFPAMTNSGSGNQGITATIPVVVVAKHLDKENELNRALFLSHLIAVYIHSKLPRLSALCAVTTAGIGSYAGIAWLFSKDFEVVSMGICNMIGDISGILCDGAGKSCTMKVSSTVQSAFKSLLLALEKKRVSGMDGIVDDEVDKSIQNLCSIASKSMSAVDKQILEIMLAKNSQ